MKKIFYLLIIIAFLYLPNPGLAFNKNNVISDWDMENYASMTLSRINAFLKAQGGALANYTTRDIDGKIKTAGEVIYNVSRKYDLSPKFMITHLQKESSLVTSGTPASHLLDWAMGFGVCDGCSKSDPRVKKYKGFAKQMDAAGNRMRNGYIADIESRGYTISGWGPGITKRTSDSHYVTPENTATAVLYTYTPWVGYHGGNTHHGGNSLFYDIWQRWFPTEDVLYPSGTMLQSSDTGTVYLIEGMQKRAFTSRAALMRYDTSKIIGATENTLDQYYKGKDIVFSNFTLIRSPQGTVYLYNDGKRRGIKSQDVLRNIGINPEEIQDVEWSDINSIPEGKAVTSKDVYAAGALLQNKENGAVFYVDPDQNRHAIWTREIMDSQFPNRPVNTVEKTDIKEFDKGTPVKLKDGEIVTSSKSNKVFVISDGYRRAFKSKKVFDKLGYQWDNLVTTSDKALKLHPKGKQVKLKTKNSSKKKKKKKKTKKKKK